MGAFTLVRFYPEPARSDRARSPEIYENGRESNPYQLPCTFRDFVKRQGPLTRFAEFEASSRRPQSMLVLAKECSELLQGFDIAFACHHLKIIVIGARYRDKLLRLVGQVIEPFPVPGRNYGVRVTMNNQHGAMDLANIFVIRELIEGQERNAREDTKSGDERTLQDEPCRRFSSSKVYCRSATD